MRSLRILNQLARSRIQIIRNNKLKQPATDEIIHLCFYIIPFAFQRNACATNTHLRALPTSRTVIKRINTHIKYRNTNTHTETTIGRYSEGRSVCAHKHSSRAQQFSTCRVVERWWYFNFVNISTWTGQIHNYCYYLPAVVVAVAVLLHGWPSYLCSCVCSVLYTLENHRYDCRCCASVLPE